MPRVPLVSALILAAAFAGPLAAAPVAEIPFHFADGFISIEARVPESASPLNLLLDSGAGASVLSVRTARRLKLKLESTDSVRGVGSEAAAWRHTPIHSMAGTVPLPAFELALDLSRADELCGKPVDGLVGVDFFRDRIVQIDYARHCLRLIPSETEAPIAERLPIKMQNGVMCVPVGVNDSRPRWTRFDTGCNDALHWVVPRPREGAVRPGVSVGFITNPNDTTLASVVLGTHSLDHVKACLHGRELFAGEAGLLGNGLLSRFLVTVDWPRHQILLGESSR